jgi:hypothetical protein
LGNSQAYPPGNSAERAGLDQRRVDLADGPADPGPWTVSSNDDLGADRRAAAQQGYAVPAQGLHARAETAIRLRLLRFPDQGCVERAAIDHPPAEALR